MKNQYYQANQLLTYLVVNFIVNINWHTPINVLISMRLKI